MQIARFVLKKKKIIFFAVFCAALCAPLLLAGCIGKSAQMSGNLRGAVKSALSSVHLDAAKSPTTEKLGGTFWNAVEFDTDDLYLPVDELRIELFLWQNGMGRFVLEPLNYDYSDEDYMCKWTFKDGGLTLTWQDGMQYYGAFEDGRLVLKYVSSMMDDTYPIVMAQAAMPLYGAHWNEVYRLYTEELLAAQKYSAAAFASKYQNLNPNSKYPEDLISARLADLNFDGIPELLLFGDDKEAENSVYMHLLTVNSGSVKMVFKGYDSGSTDIILLRKKSGGSLAYSFNFGVTDDNAYSRIFYLTRAGTKIDNTFAETAKFVELSTHFMTDDKGTSLIKNTVNGREVNKDEFFNWTFRRDETVFKDYEKIPYSVPQLGWWKGDNFDIRVFLNSYHGEEQKKQNS